MSVTTANLPTGFSWVSATNGTIPPSAVSAGKEKSGEVLYIARVQDGNCIHVGKCGNHIRGAITSHEGREQFHYNYEVLCGSSSQLKWVEQSGKFDLTKIAGTPIIGGIDDHGATLFITRSKAGSANGLNPTASAIGVQPGKISSLMTGASACYGGREYTSERYEILVYGYDGYSWVQTSGGRIPSNAVVGGKEMDAERGALYIARGWFIGSPPASLQIGKAALHLKGGSFPYGGEEVFLSDVEIFSGPSSGVSWVPVLGQFDPNSISGNPVIGGVDADGAVLYIARAQYIGGGIQPGKVSRNLSGAHFSADNTEHTTSTYEVLIYN